jgi:hypothetical protein
MSDTDSLISAYEQKIQKSITSKVLEASANNKAPQFSREEMAYLNTKADKEESKELQIETPTKEFIIKKGNKVLNVNTELFNKMNAICPEKGVLKSVVEEIPTSIPDVAERKVIPQWDTSPIQTNVQTTNKNAYEIRSDILKMALEWIQFKFHNVEPKDQISDDKVVEIAKKFYFFVESRRS